MQSQRAAVEQVAASLHAFFEAGQAGDAGVLASRLQELAMLISTAPP